MITSGDIQGHWHRAWLKSPSFNDCETNVHWMQCGSLYADIRIPPNRPDVRGASALADLPDAALMALLRAEGFAGVVALRDDVCTWHREINWHGRPEAEDSGLLELNGSDQMMETGVYGDYAELWNRRADHPASAMHLMAGSAHAFIVSIGQRFVFGVGQPDAENSRNTIAALEAGQRTWALQEQLRHVFAFGRWDGACGLAELCTNPLLEGQPVLSCTGDGALIWHAVDFLGQSREVPLTQPAQVRIDAA
ncbi:hypothetical protein ANTHELSMS3_03652 [Antarctobacter heliothermus]|uniref:Uncharacterized protein n=1 Tax=Antarctobacter heliothermus TaxID=74033 RepID=A0A222E7U1_9RHOB|nr:hypothetical protein [Antarctobacter heliothermus]ASP22274.1 hypothetical protein ANTHELSMS3_03652 [Antarctobacter heliothermus]